MMTITVFLIQNVYDLFMYEMTIVQKSIPLPVNPIPVYQGKDIFYHHDSISRDMSICLK